MKDKIKKLYEENKFVVGVIVGTITMCVAYDTGLRRLESQGYKMVRPLGYNNEGVLTVQTPKGLQYHCNK